MLGYIVSVLVFCGVISFFTFVVNATTKDSNEPVKSFISSSELCAVRPLHTVQTVETVSHVHTEATMELANVTQQVEEITDTAVIDSVFEQIENQGFLAGEVTASQINSDASDLLEEILNTLDSNASYEKEQMIVSESSVENESIEVRQIVSATADSDSIILIDRELEHLSALYGQETIAKITTTPAMGSRRALDVMLGRIEKHDNKYFLSYSNSTVEVSKAASLFVGEMVIVSGTYVNESFFKISHIELAAQSTEENTFLYDEVM